ncbi:MAG: hypothetical protein LBV00_00585 [Propionibacteriaceae bacterium]|jgi:transcriptional regulator of acetoin/glycerol metabolism|nr:hypothetical protein [Propionibacteriaceae bacterium]
MKHLVRRVLEAVESSDGASDRAEIVDSRGCIVSNSQKVQTFLGPDRVAELVARYRAGEGVKRLAGVFGVHRSTVWRHLRRAGVGVEG